MSELNPRWIGGWKASRDGPTLLLVGGIHGNEPAGVLAIRNVLERIGRQGGPVRGEVVGLLGNRRAYAHRRRYLDLDLNRVWSTEPVPPAWAPPTTGTRPAELDERAELLEALDGVLARARGPLHVLDLHTTSGPGAVFHAVFGGEEDPGESAALPAPRIARIETLLEGTLAGYLSSTGRAERSVLFEAGQHRDPTSPRRAEAAAWTLMAGLGILPPSLERTAARSRRLLERQTAGLPRRFEMVHRHPVLPGEHFRMRPGYRNFQSVRRGEVLGRDRRGPVRAIIHGRILMPLYQEAGSDGFFLVRDAARGPAERRRNV